MNGTMAPNQNSLYWSSINPWDKLGVRNIAPDPIVNAGADPGLARSSGPVGPPSPLWSPENGLFWFGVLLAGTLGLVAFSTSVGVRVAGARVKGEVGVGKV